MITSPLDITSCQVWLDATDTTTLSSLSGGAGNSLINTSLTGDFVGGWGDKSGSLRHFTNIGGSATTRPTWITALSSVRFDGVNDYLSSFFNITYTAQTVFVVVCPRTQTANARVFTQVSSGDADSTATGHYIPCYFPQTYQFGSYIAGAARSSVSNRGVGTFDIYTSFYSSASSSNFLNGVGGGYYGNSLNYNVALTRIGATATTAANYFNGDISEVIVYNRELTINERADVEYYLTRKWNFLNAIPRQVYALKSGNWSGTTLWSVSAEPSPWTFPLSSDNVYSNTFTVTADSSTRVSTINNSVLVPNISDGGSFILANGVSLTGTLVSKIGAAFDANGLNGTPALMTLAPLATATFTGYPAFYNSIPGSATLATLLSCSTGTALTINSPNLNYAFTNQNGVANQQVIRNNSSNLVINGDITIQSGNTLSIFVCQPSIQSVVKFNGNLTTAGCVIVGGNVHNAQLGTVNINGNLFTGSNAIPNNGTVNIVGAVSGADSFYGGVTTAYGTTNTVNITGTVYDYGVTSYNGSVVANVVGDVISKTNRALGSGTGNAAYVTVKGNVISYNGIGIGANAGTVSVTNGNVISLGSASTITSTNYVSVINSNIQASKAAVAINCSGTLFLSACNLINAANGNQAVYCPKLSSIPGLSATYTRHAVNGYDSYVDYWTSNATFTYPASSDVTSNTIYRNGALTGSMVLPSPSAVFLNCPVGSTATTIFQITTGNRYLITSNPLNTNFVLAGASSNTPGTIFAATSTVSFSTPITAYNSDTGRVVPLGTSTPPTVDSFWNKALSELTLPSNTAGGKLKNVVTTQQLSSIYTGLIYTVPGNF